MLDPLGIIGRQVQTEIDKQIDKYLTIMKEPKIEYYEQANGEWGWRLKGANSEIQASGEGYGTKADCLRGITAAKRNMAEADLREIKSKEEGCGE